jgi:hypothetical protein
LIVNSQNIMAALAQQFSAAFADILVELDPHAAGFAVTGTTRSRAISAA